MRKTKSSLDLSKEEIGRLFSKREKVETEVEEAGRKHAEDWLKQAWLDRARRKRELPTGPLAEQKCSLEGRRYDLAGARVEAIQIQKRLSKRWNNQYWEIIKQGVLEGVIKIHETTE